jgi:PadR family transcriptional regulator, regulatory protein PadR
MRSNLRDPIPQGTLDMLILRTLTRRGRSHGFEIAEDIAHTSANVLEVEEGSLYPALQRLLLDGYVRAEWGRTSENRRARYYQITQVGRRQLEREIQAYSRVTHAIGRILQPA